jgi:hypothetical protein
MIAMKLTTGVDLIAAVMIRTTLPDSTDATCMEKEASGSDTASNNWLSPMLFEGCPIADVEPLCLSDTDADSLLSITRFIASTKRSICSHMPN